MPTLLELQSRILGALLDASPQAGALIRDGGIDPARRLGIYANNARGNFLDALRLSYPVVLRLVGAEYFDHCARAYRAAHPSRSGDLHPAGAAFPGFLADLHAAGAHRYLGDVARLEWLCQEALMAADPGEPDPGRFLGRLGAIAPAQYESLRFRLHPAARLFASDYPAGEIWQANLGDGEPCVIDLAKGGDRLLLLRARGADGTLDLHRLDAGEWALLHALAAAADFGSAVQGAAAAQAAAGGAGFDAAAALTRFVAAGAIVDVDPGISHSFEPRAR